MTSYFSEFRVEVAHTKSIGVRHGLLPSKISRIFPKRALGPNGFDIKFIFRLFPPVFQGCPLYIS